MDVVQQIQSTSFINTVEWVRFNKTFPKNFVCISKYKPNKKRLATNKTKVNNWMKPNWTLIMQH